MDEISAKIELAIQAAVSTLRDLAPNPNTRVDGYYVNAYGNKVKGSTGNLYANAIKLRKRVNKKSTTYTIYVDSKVAPYMPFTTEPWIAAKWKGKKNPNEGWWDNAVKAIMQELATTLGGILQKQGDEEE